MSEETPRIPMLKEPELSSEFHALIERLYVEVRTATGVDDVMYQLYESSLHAQYAARLIIDRGDMIALGPYPIWRDEE